MKENGFRTLDDLILHLKGLVLVRDLRRSRGADDDELQMYSLEIARVRQHLGRCLTPRGQAPAFGYAASRGTRAG